MSKRRNTKEKWWALFCILLLLLLSACGMNSKIPVQNPDAQIENEMKDPIAKPPVEDEKEPVHQPKPDVPEKVPDKPVQDTVTGGSIEDQTEGEGREPIGEAEPEPSTDEADENLPGQTETDPKEPAEEMPQEEPVIWTDPVMEKLVRQKLAKESGEIYPEELLTIESLVYEGKTEEEQNISIEDLAQLTSLKSLVIRSAGVMDISALQGLTLLEDLDLGDNRITDISPLVNLTGLKSLYLDHNAVSDLTVLQGMPQLEVLVVEDNLITDVTPLSVLVRLNGLYLADNQIESIEPLQTLMDLEELDVSGNDIQDFSVTSFFSKLEVLIAD